MKQIMFKRWWIPAIGYTLAGGFINNLLVAPFVDINLIDYTGLTTALAILIGISGIRDYFTKDSLKKLPENSGGRGWKRYWIPITGCTLCGGFFINCILAPYFDFRVTDWAELNSILTVILGISGARDIGLAPKCNCQKASSKEKKSEEEEEEKDE